MIQLLVNLLKSLIFVLAFLLSQTLYAQTRGLDSNKAITQFTLKSWTIENGLPSNAINDIIQAQNGYIWIVTYGGVSKFDGVTFTNYGKQNNNALLTDAAKILCEDQHGTIWIGTQKGIVLSDNIHLFRDERLQVLDNSNIESLYVDGENRVWIGTNADGFFKFEDGVLSHMDDFELLTNSAIYAFYEDSQKHLWIGTINGEIFNFKNGAFIPCEGQNLNNQITSFFQDSKGTLWVCTTGGVYTIINNRLQKSTIINIPFSEFIIEDGSSNLWISSSADGLYRYNKNTHELSQLTEQNGLPSNRTTKILMDKQGNLWGGSYREGLFQISDGKFYCYSTAEGLKSNTNTSIIQYDTNEYWVANELGSIDIIKNDKVSELKTRIPIPSNQIKHLYKDSKQNVWISTYEGILKVGKKEEKLYTMSTGFPDNLIRKTFEDADGNIWVATNRSGLHRISADGTVKTFNTANGLSSDYIMTIIQYTHEIIIVGTKKGLNLIKNDSVIKQLDTEDGLPDNLVFNIYKDADGVLWIATNSGISRYANQSFINFNIESGLLTDNVFDIVEDKMGFFWMPGPKGIMKVSRASLNDYALGKTNTLSIEFYDKSDGMKSGVCLGATESLKDLKGSLWFLTSGGLAKIDPSLDYSYNQLPKVFIEEVTVNDSSYFDMQQTIVIESTSKRFDIKFTAIDLINSDEVLFKYKLEPFEKEWIDAQHIRKVSYTNINPGNYTFKVLSTNHCGVWNEDYVSIKIKVLPSWYQTILFKIVIIASVLLLVFLWSKYRLRNIRKQRNRLKKKVGEITAEIRDQKDELQAFNEELAATNEELYLQREELEFTLATLKDAQTKLVQAEKMASLGILSSGIAHEINNPLNFIHGGILAIESYFNDNSPEHLEAVKPFIAAVNIGVKRATDIVTSLRHYSQREDSPLRECNMADVIDHCLVMLQSQLKNRVTINKQYSIENCVVVGNEGKLHQAILNIISNAEQAIVEKGSIEIITKANKNTLTIVIKDSGQGIAPEHMQKIFDPFFSTKDPGKGTGLGLSITYNIIKEHQGNLEYESVIGQGTNVTITLPLKKL